MDIIIDKELIQQLREREQRNKEKIFLSTDNRYNKIGTVNTY